MMIKETSDSKEDEKLAEAAKISGEHEAAKDNGTKLNEAALKSPADDTNPATSQSEGSVNLKKRALCARACSACRKAHKACENERPCRRCVARGNEQACLREAATMSDVRISDATGGKRKLVPILKRRRIDGSPEFDFDPSKTFTHTVRGAIIQTLLPRPPANAANPNTVGAPSNNNSPTALSTTRYQYMPTAAYPQQNLPLRTIHGAPPDEIKQQAKVIMGHLLAEIKQLNQSTSSLKEEQDQLRRRLAELRSQEAQLRQFLEYPFQSSTSSDHFFASMGYADGGYPFWNIMRDRTSVSVRDEFGVFERTPRYYENQLWPSTRSSGGGGDSGSALGAYVPFAIDDATKPFIVVRFMGPNIDMPCIAVSDSFCQLLGFSREELLANGHSKVIHPDPILAAEQTRIVGPLFQKQAHGGVSHPITYRVKYWRSDDSVLTTLATTQIFYGEDGMPSWVVACVERVEGRSGVVEELPLSPSDTALRTSHAPQKIQPPPLISSQPDRPLLSPTLLVPASRNHPAYFYEEDDSPPTTTTTATSTSGFQPFDDGNRGHWAQHPSPPATYEETFHMSHIQEESPPGFYSSPPGGSYHNTTHHQQQQSYSHFSHGGKEYFAGSQDYEAIHLSHGFHPQHQQQLQQAQYPQDRYQQQYSQHPQNYPQPQHQHPQHPQHPHSLYDVHPDQVPTSRTFRPRGKDIPPHSHHGT